jgi:hypothetical protein
MHFCIYFNMFRQLIAIIRGAWFPQKLVKQFVLWMYIDYGLSRVVSCRGMLHPSTTDHSATSSMHLLLFYNNTKFDCRVNKSPLLVPTKFP